MSLDEPSLDPQCRVAAVIPAAGCGERMSHQTPKQYIEVCGRPLVVHCLAALEQVSWIMRVVVVADDIQRMRRVVTEAGLSKVTVIQGGGSRHRSIKVGLAALTDDPPDVVVIHDGVRPLLPLTTLKQVVVAAADQGAAGAVRPLVSTVLRPMMAEDKEVLQESLVRSNFRNSEMPQAFRYPVITHAYDRCSVEDLEHGTECLALALQYSGVRATLVPGTPDLWKVTEARDLVVARSVLPRHTRHMALLCRAHKTDCQSETAALVCNERAEVDNESVGTASQTSESPFLSLNAETDLVGSTLVATNLVCGDECVRVIGILENHLRSHSRSLQCYHSLNDLRSATKDRGTASVVAVVISSLRSHSRDLRPVLEKLKLGISTDTSQVILVLTLEGGESASPGVSSPLIDVTELQRDVKQVFRGHFGHVTIILRNPGQSLEDQQEKDTQLVGLVEAVLQQHSRVFHGQVLVV